MINHQQIREIFLNIFTKKINMFFYELDVSFLFEVEMILKKVYRFFIKKCSKRNKYYTNIVDKI